VDQHMRHEGPCPLMHQLLREKTFTNVHVLEDVAVVRAAVVPALRSCVWAGVTLCVQCVAAMNSPVCPAI
jgi:hypothetical protein